MAYTDLGRPPCPRAYCSGSSGYGFAVHTSLVSVDELLPLVRWKERWRFLPGVPAPGDRPPGALAGHAAGVPGAAPAFMEWVRERLDEGPEEPPPRRPVKSLEPETERVGLVPRLPASLLEPGRWRTAAPRPCRAPRDGASVHMIIPVRDE